MSENTNTVLRCTECNKPFDKDTGTIVGPEGRATLVGLEPVISVQEPRHVAIRKGPSAPGAWRAALNVIILLSH
ncbi:uncharacterized protein N7500_003709 [Penicillium coprophilum]|uniref:uncharacterized protein n=1 Tax=Penicillium coprophilum TaxID=36646 RepID=UPI0023A59EB1|nr:uncharacterized protein N7500_003709 [Penicillium coprophilum]KAJ5170926.1 hypothetical protein N7500_003709 [Penicillium coprophilum]